MIIETLEHNGHHWQFINENLTQKQHIDLVLVFGDSDKFKLPEPYLELRRIYPDAKIIGCSSSGNIMSVEVSRSQLIATAVQFEQAKVKLAFIDFDDNADIEKHSARLMHDLNGEDLKHVFVLSDGLLVNGSRLVNGLNKVSQTSITGGMAGDGARFQETWVIANDIPRQRRVVAIGFYGESLTISSGCYGGWSEFGAQRLITKSDGNILYEIDNKPALDLYKKYLGDYAQDLPNSGLRFPLSIKQNKNDPEVIRTLLAIDEQEKSITFAGDVPEGYSARLMKPDIEVLIDGAGKAAEGIRQANSNTALGLIVSCVGRKIIMSQEVEEELEAVEHILGNNVQLTGFYSYGEIAPFAKNPLSCELHNQTMTLTTIYEDIPKQ